MRVRFQYNRIVDIYFVLISLIREVTSPVPVHYGTGSCQIRDYPLFYGTGDNPLVVFQFKLVPS